MSIKIKNCGLMSEEDIKAASHSGSDYVGVVHFPASPRHIALGRLSSLLEAARKNNVKSVLLLVNPSDALLEEVISAKPDYLQLHGNESNERIAEIKNHYSIPIIKAAGIENEADIEALNQYEAADMLLLDAKPPKEASVPGGRGEAFDWSLLSHANISKPWFLAGGLTVDNVTNAVNISEAQMVDVSSGIELHPGQKDATKIAEFNQLVKSL